MHGWVTTVDQEIQFEDELALHVTIAEKSLEVAPHPNSLDDRDTNDWIPSTSVAANLSLLTKTLFTISVLSSLAPTVRARRTGASLC